ncbi:E3 SUMO-protein ligase ZBED1 [Nematolebias whitei]|uniref:E3 SUMO-protein ligase ZBED1 n=1 Tax=Nematolebias whitei TaxID=451745 RepID=UPI0018978B7C|nr:E3 SUMO-protein ligase ZBED1 [Nematolebias whitei]
MDSEWRRPPRSKVWLNFNRRTAQSAQCKTCSKFISCKGGCTTNMMKHLRVHGIEITPCTVICALRRPASSRSNRQPTALQSASEKRPEMANVSQTADQTQPCAPFIIESEEKMSVQQINECHRKVMEYIVKMLRPLSEVESPRFRDLVKTLNPMYTPPTRDCLSNKLIPSWYTEEKSSVITELSDVSSVALTCDGWSSITQDHYLTITAHYTVEGKLQQKVLKTKAVYEAQTGGVVAEEISNILTEFCIFDKVVAITVNNAASMDEAIKRLQLVKICCFAHTLNIATQRLYAVDSLNQWVAKVRTIVVWMKRCLVAKMVLREKQELLKLPRHSLILDVGTRWDSFYLMLERFTEQYPAILATSLDQRLSKNMERDSLAQLTEEDFRRAEDLTNLMKLLYTCTCVSSEKGATCGQILPILQKLEAHLTVKEGDTVFVSNLKNQIWANLSEHYQNDEIRNFLQVATALDPRFKKKVDDGVWDQIQRKLIEQSTEKDCGDHGVTVKSENEGVKEEEEMCMIAEMEPPLCKLSRKTPLEELFEEEDAQLLMSLKSSMSIKKRAERELQLYQKVPATTEALEDHRPPSGALSPGIGSCSGGVSTDRGGGCWVELLSELRNVTHGRDGDLQVGAFTEESGTRRRGNEQESDKPGEMVKVHPISAIPAEVNG